MSRRRFAPGAGFQALMREGGLAFRSGTLKGSHTKYQELEPHRYPGVIISLDKDGEITVRPGMPNEPVVILVVRRVGPTTAVITDMEGEIYSELMRVTDACRLLRDLTER